MAEQTTRSPSSRRFAWLAAAIVFAIAAYTGGWYYVASLVDQEASKTIASVNGNGIRFNCDNNRVNGFPFRLGLNCDRVVFEHQVEGLVFTAGAFRSAAQVYNPTFLVSELDGNAKLEIRGFPPLTFDWENLRSSVRLASPLPTRLSLEGRKIGATANADRPSIRNLFTAKRIEAHMRPNNSALDLAASFADLLIDRSLLEDRILPAISGGLDLAIDEGVRLATTPNKSLRGNSGIIRNAYLSPGDNSVIRASGPFEVDNQGLVNAQIAIKVDGVEKLARIATEAFPESASEIENFAASLKALGDDQELPLHVVKGKISYGFFELGQIPPLP
ncbi:MAG: DUF2125 domain-containing protein [Rhizobiaceae bacterium]